MCLVKALCSSGVSECAAIFFKVVMSLWVGEFMLSAHMACMCKLYDVCCVYGGCVLTFYWIKPGLNGAG